MENKSGQALIVNLLLFVMAIGVMVAMIPVLNAFMGWAQQSDSLNCVGYSVNGNPNATLSYNASLASNTLACLAIRLYLPYILLVVLVVGVAKLMSDRTGTQPSFG